MLHAKSVEHPRFSQTVGQGTTECINSQWVSWTELGWSLEHLPLVLRLVDHQQDLELLGQRLRRSRLLHECRCRCSCLLDRIGDGADRAEEARGATEGRRGGWGLGLLGLLRYLAEAPFLTCWGAGGCLGWCYSFGRGLSWAWSRGCDLLRRGRHGRWRWSRRVRPLEVCHVAIRKVGHEGAVREPASEEVHGGKRSTDLIPSGSGWSGSRVVQEGDQRFDEWQRAAQSCVGARHVMESRCRAGETESREDGMDGLSSGPVFERQLSKAQPSQRNRACVMCWSSSWGSARLLTNVCVRARERKRELQRESEREGWWLPSCPPSCCKPNVLRRCCSLCLSHPFTHSYSLGPPPPPPFLSPSYITGYVCMSCRSYKVLRAVCNHWKGVSCKHALGGVHRWQHHPPCSARPSSLSCRPSTIHFCSSLLPFSPHIHASSSEISLCYVGVMEDGIGWWAQPARSQRRILSMEAENRCSYCSHWLI